MKEEFTQRNKSLRFREKEDTASAGGGGEALELMKEVREVKWAGATQNRRRK